MTAGPEFDISDLDDVRRERLFALLDTRPVPHELGDDGQTITALPSYERELSRLVEAARYEKKPRGQRFTMPVVAEPVRLRRRLLIYLADVLVLTPIVLIAERPEGQEVGAAITLTLVALFATAGLGRPGHTPGRWLLGVDLCRRDGSPATLRAATVRWSMREAPASLSAVLLWTAPDLGIGPWLELFAGVWFMIVIGSAFLDAQRRGINDLVADTVLYRRRDLEAFVTANGNEMARRVPFCPVSDDDSGAPDGSTPPTDVDAVDVVDDADGGETADVDSRAVVATQSKWCPSCGDEYEVHVTACADCRIPLVSEEPTELQPVTPKESVPYAERAQAFDLQHFDDEQIGALKQRLMEDPIEHQWANERMVVAYPGYVEIMERYLKEVRTGLGPDGGVDELAGQVVGLGRRVVANVLDAVIAGPVLAIIGGLIAEMRWIAVAGLVLTVLNNTLGTGEPGRTIGRRLTRSALRARNGDALQVGEAATRWLARDLPLVLLLLLLAAGLTGGIVEWTLYSWVAWWIVVGGSIVSDRLHRSLADQVADSVVYELPLFDPTEPEPIEPELIS